MKLDQETVTEVRQHLNNAETILYAYLDQSFGSFKKAPEDHPLFKALQSINEVGVMFASQDDDEEEGA